MLLFLSNSHSGVIVNCQIMKVHDGAPGMVCGVYKKEPENMNVR